MFCAIATTIDRCKTESVVDVFQVVKAQRIQKPGLVLTVVSIAITKHNDTSVSILLYLRVYACIIMMCGECVCVCART